MLQRFHNISYLISATLLCSFLIPVASTSLYAFSQDQSIEIKLDSHASIHVDLAPFLHPTDIISQLFSPLRDNTHFRSRDQHINSRYWLRLSPLLNKMDISRYKYISFGPFDRTIIYQLDGSSLKEVGRLGVLYKSQSADRSPHFTLFPLDNLDTSKETFVQLSTGYKNNLDIKSIDVRAYTHDAIQQKYNLNGHASTKGLVQTGLIFYLILLIFGTVLLSLSNQNMKYLSFAGLCIALMIFYSRNLEPYYSIPILWGHWDEAVIKWENLCRSGISISFIIFILVNFKLGLYKKYLCISTAIISILSIALGIYSALIIGPFSHGSAIYDALFLIEICLSIGNSVLLLYLVWRYNDGLFGKPFVYATLLFLISAYASIWLHTTWLGNLDSIFSSKMYSTYAVIIYLGVLSYLMVKYLTQRETHIELTMQKNQQLHKINEAKSKLFADITHEFRTPLTIIQGLAQEISLEPARKLTIMRSSENLLQLVDDLRDISLLETNHLSIQYIQSDIVSYIQYLTESFQSLAAQKNIDITFTTNQDSLLMDFDDNRIRQIATNLISNAIHFTPKNGCIEVQMVASESSVSWSVKDNGVGIASSEKSKIYTRYYSNHEHATGTYTSTGIGLSIVNELVTLMNGEIRLESEVGLGSEFIIRLPVLRDAPLVKLKTSDGDQQSDVIGIKPKHYSSNDKLILIVEDNPDIADYIDDCLSDQYKILKAAHGEAAYSLAETHMPDIIISDVMMPIMDGIDLMKKLKSNQKTNHIPVIMLTAKSSQKDRELALSSGANSYLTKPFSRNELQIRIDNMFNRNALLRDKYGHGLAMQRRDIPQWLTQLENMINTDMHEELSVDHICKMLYMSRSQLHRKIKAETGQSTSAYIKQVRMKKANQLLQNTNQTIVQIAHTVGYKNAGHFSTDYKKLFGTSPSEIR